jgi:GT2 family glycosyltransferase
MNETAARPTTCDVTLSIVNTNNRELLQKCLETIAATLKRTTYEIIVVDNASEDGSAEMVATSFPTARLIRNPTRQGYGASHNRAVAQARGRYVLVLNEDMEMLPNAVDAMVEEADSIPELGALGCRILNPDRSLQHSCFRFPTLAQELFEAAFPYTLIFPTSGVRSKMYGWPHHERRDVDIVVGCCMLVPRSVIDRIGAFDPAYFVYSEEHDWCKRMKNAGLRVAFTPNAEMIHYGGQTSKRMSLRMALVQLESRTRYFSKHHGALSALALRVIMAFGASLRAAGWGARLLLSRSAEGVASTKFNEYWASLKFVTTLKR